VADVYISMVTVAWGHPVGGLVVVGRILDRQNCSRPKEGKIGSVRKVRMHLRRLDSRITLRLPGDTGEWFDTPVSTVQYVSSTQ
jgi:hypothetical protein